MWTRNLTAMTQVMTLWFWIQTNQAHWNIGTSLSKLKSAVIRKISSFSYQLFNWVDHYILLFFHSTFLHFYIFRLNLFFRTEILYQMTQAALWLGMKPSTALLDIPSVNATKMMVSASGHASGCVDCHINRIR